MVVPPGGVASHPPLPWPGGRWRIAGVAGGHNEQARDLMKGFTEPCVPCPELRQVVHLSVMTPGDPPFDQWLCAVQRAWGGNPDADEAHAPPRFLNGFGE